MTFALPGVLLYRYRTDRFGHLDIQLSELDACIPLVQLIMVRAADIEHETVQEELGFREFSTWMKFGQLPASHNSNSFLRQRAEFPESPPCVVCCVS